MEKTEAAAVDFPTASTPSTRALNWQNGDRALPPRKPPGTSEDLRGGDLPGVLGDKGRTRSSPTFRRFFAGFSWTLVVFSWHP